MMDHKIEAEVISKLSTASKDKESQMRTCGIIINLANLLCMEACYNQVPNEAYSNIIANAKMAVAILCEQHEGAQAEYESIIASAKEKLDELDVIAKMQEEVAERLRSTKSISEIDQAKIDEALRKLENNSKRNGMND